jgi:hypothetical protein
MAADKLILRHPAKFSNRHSRGSNRESSFLITSSILDSRFRGNDGLTPEPITVVELNGCLQEMGI